MGKPLPEQAEEVIEEGIMAGRTEDEIIEELEALSRLTDEEMAERGIFPPKEPSAPAPRPKRSIYREDNEGPALLFKPLDPDPAPHLDLAPPLNVENSADNDHSLPAPPAPADGVAPLAPPGFAPARVRERSDGWSANRQRRFISALAETGCVSEACAEVGLTPRSAYRLRERPLAAGFREAWRHAEAMASARLTAIAFDRAIHGSVERIYKDGELVAERRKPSDRLLMWLLSHHDPETYGWLAKQVPGGVHPSFYPLHNARKKMGAALDSLTDMTVEDCPTEWVGGTDYAIDERQSDVS